MEQISPNILDITLLVVTTLLVMALIAKRYMSSNWYLITLEYNKSHKNKFIKSQQHKGDKINNSFVQTVIQINSPNSLIADLFEKFPKDKYNNWRIVSIEKIS